jgi:hypothetical protein
MHRWVLILGTPSKTRQRLHPDTSAKSRPGLRATWCIATPGETTVRITVRGHLAGET